MSMLRYGSVRRACVSAALVRSRPDLFSEKCGRFMMNLTVARRVALTPAEHAGCLRWMDPKCDRSDA